MPSTDCTHTRTIHPPGEFNEDTNSYDYPEPHRESTTEDIDVGRYRCTQCGLVMYYTGRWRDHWEKGIRCD